MPISHYPSTDSYASLHLASLSSLISCLTPLSTTDVARPSSSRRRRSPFIFPPTSLARPSSSRRRRSLVLHLLADVARSSSSVRLIVVYSSFVSSSSRSSFFLRWIFKVAWLTPDDLRRWTLWQHSFFCFRIIIFSFLSFVFFVSDIFLLVLRFLFSVFNFYVYYLFLLVIQL